MVDAIKLLNHHWLCQCWNSFTAIVICIVIYDFQINTSQVALSTNFICRCMTGVNMTRCLRTRYGKLEGTYFDISYTWMIRLEFASLYTTRAQSISEYARVLDDGNRFLRIKDTNIYFLIRWCYQRFGVSVSGFQWYVLFSTSSGTNLDIYVCWYGTKISHTSVDLHVVCQWFVFFSTTK